MLHFDISACAVHALSVAMEKWSQGNCKFHLIASHCILLHGVKLIYVCTCQKEFSSKTPEYIATQLAAFTKMRVMRMDKRNLLQADGAQRGAQELEGRISEKISRWIAQDVLFSPNRAAVVVSFAKWIEVSH